MKPLKEINIKRIFIYVITTIAVIALYLGLVHLVLMAANVSKSAPSVVIGLTSKRQFALGALGIGLISVIFGWRAFRKSSRRVSVVKGKSGHLVALVSGVLAVIAGGWSLATANGGPGSGNGVLGSAQALVLGLTGMLLGGLAIARFRKKHPQSEPETLL